MVAAIELHSALVHSNDGGDSPVRAGFTVQSGSSPGRRAGRTKVSKPMPFWTPITV
jgi:hypothetical protein